MITMYRELNNLTLTHLYDEAHQKLGERTLWISVLEDEIRQRLKTIAHYLNRGHSTRHLSSELGEKVELLMRHQADGFEAMLSIFEIEAEMDRRSIGDKE